MKLGIVFVFSCALILVSCGSETKQSDNSSLSVSQFSEQKSAGEDYYKQNLEKNINKYCGMCHKNPAPDYATAKTQIVPKKPAESSLYLYATGKRNHKAVWQEGSEKAEFLRQWIMIEE